MQPRIDKLYCVTYPLGGGAGPTAQAQRRRLLQTNAAKLGMVSLSCDAPMAFTSAVGALPPGLCLRARAAAAVSAAGQLILESLVCQMVSLFHGDLAWQAVSTKLPHHLRTPY